jgi:hypothetical protein
MTRALALLLLSTSAATVHSDSPSLSVSLAIPAREEGPRRVTTGSATAHFHVLLSSQTNSPQRIWDEAFSWGYSALSFELVAENGAVRVIRKRPMDFTVNFPAWSTLEPHGHLVIDVHLGDRRVWDGVPPTLPNCELIQMRAVFEVTPDVESRRLHVWTGRVVSDLAQVMLCP